MDSAGVTHIFLGNTLRFLSLFSGIEAASCAWKPLGWQCVAVSEIDPFPSAVLAHHYPDVPNLGDVTKITEQTIAGLGQIDLVVFGSPCQDLSVAGKRAGFSGERSGLFHTAIRLIQWARKHSGCRFALWENVPGAFSSNQGRDFAAVVSEMAGLADVDVPANGWGTEGCALGDDALLEWAVLDAQWFGVAQRRRRVFAIADFGDWSNRPPILLERDSLRGDTAPSREAGQSTAHDVAPSLTASGRGVERIGETRGQDPVVAVPAEGCWWDGGQVSQTLDAVLAKGQTMPEKNRFPAVLQPVAFDTTQVTSKANRSNPKPGDPCHTLASGAHPPLIAFDSRQDPVSSNQVFGALGSSSPQAQALAYGIRTANTSSNGWGIQEEVTHTLDCAQGVARDSREGTTEQERSGKGWVGETPFAVRRLTVEECEFLQGFPRGYSKIPWRKKPAEDCPDGPRYKALGNSMAVPVMRHIGTKIAAAIHLKINNGDGHALRSL